VYYAIVEMDIFTYKCVSLADWVNLRDAMTFMMTKYWIGTPKDWGEPPKAVAKRYKAACNGS
jgi:hypothetical protein